MDVAENQHAASPDGDTVEVTQTVDLSSPDCPVAVADLPPQIPLPVEPTKEPSDVTPPEVREDIPGQKHTDLTIRSHLVQAALDGKTIGPSTGSKSPEWLAMKASGEDLWREALDLKAFFVSRGHTSNRSRGLTVWEMCERYHRTKERLVAQGKIVLRKPKPAGDGSDLGAAPPADDAAADDSTEKDGGPNGEQPADLAARVDPSSQVDSEIPGPLPGWIGDFDADHKANIFWVAGALAPDFTGRAPNPIAAALLEFAKLNQLAFWSQIYSKAAAAKKDEDKDDRFKDDGRKMRDLLDKLEGIAKETAKTKKRVKKVEDVVGVRGGEDTD